MPCDLLPIAAVWLAAMNLAAFCMRGLDKTFARRRMRRIPEVVLFLPAMLGGAAGGWAGMYLFRHKTRHWYFKWGLPAILIAQLVLATWLFWMCNGRP